jgi:hypothetical protein
MESRFGYDFSRVRLHTDSKAAESAKAVNANAYTVGQDIVLASSFGIAGTTEGRSLLAHELVHTIQQGNSTGVQRSALEVSKQNDPLEREAEEVARAALLGKSPRIPAQSGAAVARQGDELDAGTSESGPVDASLPGGVATPEPEVSSPPTNPPQDQSKRGLTASEKAEATLVYGTSMNYDSIILEEDSVMSVGGYARTTPYTVNFPPGSFGRSDFIPWLIHELMHSWQYQHGTGVTKTLFYAIFGTYDYGGEAGLRAATVAGRGLKSFNTEQQGDIAEDYYKRLKGGQDVSAWIPFKNEIQGSSAASP